METKIVKHRLTLDEKETIIRMYVNGTPISHLAQKFKVSRPTIYSVVQKMDEDDRKKIDFYVEKKDENKENMELSSYTPTSFLGVTVDPENGSSDPRIRKALDKSFKLLDIMEFIKTTKFKLNMLMFDYFSTNGPKAHSYDMLAGGQHGVAGCCRKPPSASAPTDFRMVWV